RAGTGPKGRDRCKRDNRTHFANAVYRWSKPRSGQYPDNLYPTNRRGCELIRKGDARNSRFHNARSLLVRASPLSFRKTLRLYPDSVGTRRAHGAEKILCPLRTSGSKWKCAQARTLLSCRGWCAIDQGFDPANRTSDRRLCLQTPRRAEFEMTLPPAARCARVQAVLRVRRPTIARRD